jgi:fermentation-respiration switch protein FrsA (DUF1100 family)
MRLSLPQATARRLMVSLAVVAIAAGAELIRRRSVSYRQRMAHHSSERRRLSAEREVLLSGANADSAMRAVVMFDAERHRQAIAWHAEREEENRLATWQPWKAVESDRLGLLWPPIPPELYPTSVSGPPTQSDRNTTPLVDAFLFHPRRFPRGEWAPKDLSFEDVWFQAADGVRLNGWFAEAKAPRAVVLYAEGNAGNITGRRWVLELFRDRLDSSVLIFDYRGYGRSEGSPRVSGILKDARAARRWLAGRTAVAEGDIVLVGHSLGGAVAVDLAACDGARGLVLENTFSSLADVTESHFGRLARPLASDLLDSVSRIRGYHGPLLQTHGDVDTIIPYDLGRRLYEAAGEPKEFVDVRGGDHNDPPLREYLLVLDRFLRSLPPRSQERADPTVSPARE